MTPKRRGAAFLLTLCCTLSLLLASCGSSKISTTGSTISNQTNKFSALATATSTATTNMKGEFLGSDTARTDWIGLSSNGNRIVAFTSDGTANTTPTFAQWFRGTIKNNSVNTTTSSGDHLIAQLTQDTATGTVTLKNGKTFPFVANAVPMNSSMAGLYSSTRTVNGDQYQAGWVIAPPNGTSFTPTPGIMGTTTPGIMGTTTPGIMGTTTPGIMGTTTPSATGTASVTTGTLQSAGAIINETTGKVMQAPALTPQDLSQKQVAVPALGTFKLRQCQQDQC